MRHQAIAILSAGVVAISLAGCASTGPAEPSIAVMPAKGKSFAAFQRDDEICQAAAQQAVGYRSPGQVANDQTVGGAVVGTAVGALAGAAIGAAAGNAGVGAAIGAGTGLAGGAIIGNANGNASAASIQARYDMVYAQCMSSKGNRILERGAPIPPPPPPGPSVVVVEEPTYFYPRPYAWTPGPYVYRRYWW